MVRRPMYPRVRRELNFQLIELDGEPTVLVQDPWELSGGPLALSQGAYFLLQRLDGCHSLEDLRQAWSQASGVQLSQEHLEALLTTFESAYLLEGRHFEQAYNAVVSAYQASQLRPSVHAGRSYPDDPQELTTWLETLLAEGAQYAHEPCDLLVVPHLDFRVEREAYAAAYRSLQGQSYDRVIVIGTGHQMSQGLFCTTRKAFETPLGRVDCDQDALDHLEAAAGSQLSPNDFPHRQEHTIEFQLVFLQHLLQGTDFLLVPILCGSMYPYLRQLERPSELSEVRDVLEVLRGLLTPRTLLVASVDFSHIGRKFGHPQHARELLEGARKHDQALLSALCAGDADAFWREGRRVMDHYNVCGFSTLACLLELFPMQGKTLRHDVWLEEETDSAVSFATATLRRRT